MRANITVRMDNAAFFEEEDGQGRELARILRKLAGELDKEMPSYFEGYGLYDINGNHVGTVTIK